MKFVISFLFGLLMSGLALIKTQGKTDFGDFYLFGMKEFGQSNMSWLRDFIDIILLIPELILNDIWIHILRIMETSYPDITIQHIFIISTFIIYFFASFLTQSLANLLKGNEKRVFIIFIIAVYLIPLYYIKSHYL